MGLKEYIPRKLPKGFVRNLVRTGLGAAKYIGPLMKAMDDYGFRGPKELDAATPRYYEKPGEVFTLLKTMASQDDPDLSPRGIFDRRASSG
jgi:hypothetical protein